MRAFVLDVSACMPWCCEDETTPKAVVFTDNPVSQPESSFAVLGYWSLFRTHPWIAWRTGGAHEA